MAIGSLSCIICCLGLDIIHNDLVKKPKIDSSVVRRNRRDGIISRSYGLTIENSQISDNGVSGKLKLAI